MPIAKMRASNCPTKATATTTRPSHQPNKESSLESLQAPSTVSTSARRASPQGAGTGVVRRAGSVIGMAKELLNIGQPQALLLQAMAEGITAQRFRSIVGGTLEIGTATPKVASDLLLSLGFKKLHDGYTLTDPRFVKIVELQDGIMGIARATIESADERASIAITIDRGWKLI